MRYAILCFLLLVATGIKADTDYSSIEAMISNHKTERTVLEIRTLAELGVLKLHQKRVLPLNA